MASIPGENYPNGRGPATHVPRSRQRSAKHLEARKRKAADHVDGEGLHTPAVHGPIISASAPDTNSAAAFTGSAARGACLAVVWTYEWPSSLPIIGRPSPGADRSTPHNGIGRTKKAAATKASSARRLSVNTGDGHLSPLRQKCMSLDAATRPKATSEEAKRLVAQHDFTSVQNSVPGRLNAQ
jgi:hypothetical protein